jgi:hypothetical protein
VSGASCGCGSTAAVSLDDAVRDCLTAAAPELGVEITQQAARPPLIPVGAVRRRAEGAT